MKKFKFLLVFALVLTVISTVAFATDSAIIDGATNNEIIYTGTGALEISVVSNADYETDSAQAWIVFDQSKWTVSSASTSVAGGTAVVNVATGQPTMSSLTLASLAKGDKILAAVFTPIDGANVIGSEFKVYTYWYDSDTYDEVETNNVVYTVKAAAPAVTKYSVSFKDYADNDTTADENTSITLPVAPAVGKNQQFNGWKADGITYAASTEYTVTKDVTFTADITDIEIPQPTAKENIITVELDGTKYSDIFEGIYSVIPGKATIDSFGVKATKVSNGAVKTFTKAGLGEITGDSKYIYRLAIVGVTDKAEITTVPFAAYTAE